MKLRPFELGLVIIFGVLAAVALFIMATYDSPEDVRDKELRAVGEVVVWGTIPADGINRLFLELSEENPLFRQIFYRYISPERFDSVLTESLANQNGPNIILVSQEKLVTLRSRIQSFPYDQRDLKDTYLDGAQIFALSDGLYGYPVAVDPIMMFWNKDILTNAGFLTPPKTWETLVSTMFPELIKRDFDRTINRSVVAMGEYNNVRNSFAVLSTLLLQGGSLGVVEGGGEYTVKLGVPRSGTGNPLRSSINFYTIFSKANNSLYSWNRSLPQDRSQFISGDLVFYFGFSSEAREIEQANPNLNFDMAEVPQGAEATIRRTYGKTYAFSVLKLSNNKAGAITAVSTLASPAVANQIAVNNNLVPAYRAAVALGSGDVYGRIAYKSASISFGWLNPNRRSADSVFGTMVKDINENRRSVDSATSDITRRLVEAY